MLLTEEEHRRGIVRWAGKPDATVVISSHDKSVVSLPMRESTGSVPTVVPNGDGEIEVLPIEGDVVQPPFRIVWDRLVGEEIEARGFDTELGAFHLVGMTGPIELERIVVAVPYLCWDAPWSVRVGDISVRFVNVLRLERSGDQSFVHEPDTSVFTATVGTRTFEGWLIDIIAPREIEDHSEVVYSVLALLSLVVGDAAIGEVIHRELRQPVRGLAGCETPIIFHPIPSAPNQTLRMPIPISEERLREFDRLLTVIATDDAVRDDTLLALRWLERSLRRGDPIDGFTAAVTGLDSVVTRRSDRQGFEVPFADILRDPRVAEFLASLRGEYPEEHVKRLLERLLDKRPSAQDRFAGIAEALGLGPDRKVEFRESNKQRGPIVHGSAGTVERPLANKTTKLLSDVLLSVIATSPQA